MIAQLPQRPSLSQVARMQYQLRRLDPDASIAVDYDSREVLIRARLNRTQVEGAFNDLGIVPLALTPSAGGCCGGCGCG
jgi:hypothetical protein